MKKIDPTISKYMSELSKKRKNKRGGFSNKELAKKAGDAGRETQRLKRQKPTQS